MKNQSNILLAICLFLLLSHFAYPQRIQNSPIKINGGININLGAYQSYGIDNRRDPFSYLITGNLNFRLNGFTIPVGASFSQQESRFLQPFNQFGLSPKYKWVQTHFGYRNLSFNPFTLNGHTFLGTGVEVEMPWETGPRIKISTMYGRLRRAVDPAEASLNEGIAAYKRIGYGAKLQLSQRGNAANTIAIDVFRAKDRENSIGQAVDAYEILPKENATVGLYGQYQLFRKLILRGHYGFSALTRDVRTNDENIASIGTSFLRNLVDGFLLSPNASTQYKSAYSGAINWTDRMYTVGLEYKRIDPGYETLGSYFFQNDIENITLNSGFTLDGGKVRINGSIGQQLNNLEGDKSTQTTRFIGSLNYVHTFSDRLGVNVNLSNFSSEVKVEQDLLSDSLNLYQLNTNINAGISYILSEDNANQAVTINAAYQVGNSRDEYRIFESVNTFYQLNTSYRHKIPEKNLLLTVGINYSQNRAMTGNNTILGPRMSIVKNLLKKKGRISYALGYNRNSLTDNGSFVVMTNQLSGSYRISRKTSYGLNIGLISKIDNRSFGQSYSELRLRTSYRLNF